MLLKLNRETTSDGKASKSEADDGLQNSKKEKKNKKLDKKKERKEGKISENDVATEMKEKSGTGEMKGSASKSDKLSFIDNFIKAQ